MVDCAASRLSSLASSSSRPDQLEEAASWQSAFGGGEVRSYPADYRPRGAGSSLLGLTFPQLRPVGRQCLAALQSHAGGKVPAFLIPPFPSPPPPPPSSLFLLASSSDFILFLFLTLKNITSNKKL